MFRFKRNSKARDGGLGSVNTFTLKEARERVRKYRQLVADGIDPIEDRRAKRDEAKAQDFGKMLFKDAAQRFLDLHLSE